MKTFIKSNQKSIVIYFAGLLLLGITGCKKAIDVGPPPTKLSSETIFENPGSAEAAIAGILSKMALSTNMYNGSASMSLQQGQAADELVGYTAVSSQFYTNNLTSQANYYWTEIYLEMFGINSAVKGLTNSVALAPALRDQLLGEMKFTRAFIYFYAVNLFGDVPMPLTTDYVVNNTLSRAPQQQVYDQIIKDLKDAQGLLPDNSYLSGVGAITTERVHPNRQSASAMLARVYLYQKDWVNAEALSTSVINSSGYKLEAINSVFLKASQEAIWQLAPPTGLNNSDAANLVITARPPNFGQLGLNNNLLNAFEQGDARLANWVGTFVAPALGPLPATTYRFAYKYKAFLINSTTPITEYPIMLRLAEQYLIRAEARAQQGNIGGAQTDLNAIRSRATLPNTTAATKDDLLNAVAHERQVELFTEMGHRWFDLRRTGKIDAVMSVVTPQKGGTWNINKQLIPLPASEILLNKNLVQNPGY